MCVEVQSVRRVVKEIAMTNIVYVKVVETDAVVVELAAKVGASAKSVAATINNDRYRKAYNRVKQARDKQMREFFKANPEMLPKEGGKS